MGLKGSRTFVGFGFGPIQSGLFLYEAYYSGAFRRLVVAEVLSDVVSAVHRNGGKCVVNIAFQDRVEQGQLDSVELLDPAQVDDRQCLIDAIAEAEEISTAVPSVNHYVSGDDEGSLHQILAMGLCKKVAIDGPRAVVYTAENNNHAAEILKAHVMKQIPKEQHLEVLTRVRFINTVIGKMSQVLTDLQEIQQRQLTTITPDLPRAFLVESFSQILISQIQFDTPFHRGLAQFIEKENLLPFEEAKLYGHNATHALGGYLGYWAGVDYVADLEKLPGMVDFLWVAFIEESGQALIRKHSGVDDLFTPHGYRNYAEDLLKRMMNPNLLDRIERVTRDPARKLGWHDRLIGTMRVALDHGLQPRRYALGAAAALAVLNNGIFSSDLLEELWQPAAPDERQKAKVIDMITDAWIALEKWKNGSVQSL